jgi:hypothetical protein
MSKSSSLVQYTEFPLCATEYGGNDNSHSLQSVVQVLDGQQFRGKNSSALCGNKVQVLRHTANESCRKHIFFLLI